MRKLLLIFLIGITVVISACVLPEPVPEGYVRLPNIEGKVESEIRVELESLGVKVAFLQRNYVELERSNQFIEYGNFMSVGDTVKENTFVTVIISATLLDTETYFEVIDLPYEGPLLSEHFFDLPLYVYSESLLRYRGGGGAFDVDFDPSSGLGRCIDGDTTVFRYPQDIYEKITSNTPSTRYLNIDTPETWSGGEEEWGKLASVYVCDLLMSAERIVLQTDPGDNLTGNYGRLLAWIWIMLPDEDEFFLLNYMTVRQGLGEVAYLFGAGSTDVTVYDGKNYTAWMFEAEALAIEDQLGMHGNLMDWYWDYDNNRPHPTRW